MAHRNVHYEAAFEAYLRHRGIPYVAVDEAKRALFATSKLKSFDFVVYSHNGPNLLVDVKGRSCRDRANRVGFETWSPERDVTDLQQWEQVFGEGFKAVLMFVYWVDPPLLPDGGVFEFKDKSYMMMGVDLAEYRNHMRRRSQKWETVGVPAESFKDIAKPIDNWL